MTLSILIILASFAMLVYWFRYSCLLILDSQWDGDLARRVAEQNDMSFSRLEYSLGRVKCDAELDELYFQLDRDLASVRQLLAANKRQAEDGDQLELKMLLTNFNVLRVQYWFARLGWFAQAQQSLREMSRVVGYLASLTEAQSAARG